MLDFSLFLPICNSLYFRYSIFWICFIISNLFLQFRAGKWWNPCFIHKAGSFDFYFQEKKLAVFWWKCLFWWLADLFFLFREKIQGNWIYTMSGVFRCQPFAGENMPQMSPTMCTGYFCTLPIGINGSFNSAFYFIVKTGPATMGIKLIGGAIEWGIASFTQIGSFPVKVVINSGIRPLSSFSFNYWPF